MRTIEQLDEWLLTGRITGDQHRRIAPLVRRQRIPLFAELNTALYLGVLAFAAGLTWTANTYSAAWGDAAILVPATLVMLACFAYCVPKTPPYSNGKVESPLLAFDYVLYLACLIFGIELGYIEYRFGILQTQWDTWLLVSAALYLLVAYRCDNRFVLSLGLATLGGWFGVRVAHFQVAAIETIRLSALVYAAIVAVIGTALFVWRIKRHFLETYLHVAANVALAALLSGVFDANHTWLWLVVLLAAAAGAIGAGARFRRFAFVVYGTLYGYVGLSSKVLDAIGDDAAGLAYVVVSAASVIIALVVLARGFGREE